MSLVEKMVLVVRGRLGLSWEVFTFGHFKRLIRV